MIKTMNKDIPPANSLFIEETEKSEGDGRIDHVIEKSIELFKTVPIMNQCKSLVSIWKK